ncbi:hypothetical protein GCM10009409_25510 [Shewanella saliphila]|uniref:Universal stress protein B n=1 Tax=Shewanella saliphila TaxID=2282698 RepID=A0ABQ2Q998_9GAMM|nr:hypothetical protein GCM10009409_25510 [Shewanella saliphila]
MVTIIGTIVTLIAATFAIYRLNKCTHSIYLYIQQHYPDEYQHCDALGRNAGGGRHNTSLFVMESFNSGKLANIDDPALQQMRQRLSRLKALFILSPTLIFLTITIIAEPWTN